jgi:transposase
VSTQIDSDRLTDEQWARIAPLMPGGCKGKRGPRSDNRRFMDAIVWMARSGARWRDLPAHYGDYQVVKRRYYDWIERDVLTGIFKALSTELELALVSVDATVVRAHQHAAGARTKKGGLMPRGWAAREAA